MPVNNQVKRQETYSGLTDTLGNYTVVFTTPYQNIPNIQQNLIGGTVLQDSRVNQIGTLGFTVMAFTRSSVTNLPVIGNLAQALIGVNTVPLVGGVVHVLVTES